MKSELELAERPRPHTPPTSSGSEPIDGEHVRCDHGAPSSSMGSALVQRARPAEAKPVVSVVITDFRRHDFVREAVLSVLSGDQVPGLVEIIVLKDFWNQTIDAFLSEHGVRTITKDFSTVGAMLAEGIEGAVGEVICFLDDDDRFGPEKIGKVAKLFDEDPNLGMVRNAYEPIDVLGRPLPAWEERRPQPMDLLVIDASRNGGHLLPWISRFNAYANLSTYSIRRRLLLPWLSELRRITTAQDLFLAVVANLSGCSQRIEPSRWSRYRVHQSTSHPTIDNGARQSEVQELSREVVTAQLLLGALRGVRRDSLAYRLVRSFELDARLTLFLLSPNERLGIREWLTFSLLIGWRRRPYLLREWLWCLPRWLFPSRASRIYESRRRRDLRGAITPANQRERALA